MANNPTLFERIKEFVLLGYDNNEIAETLNISSNSGYIRKVRREITRPTETPSKSPAVTPKKYYKLMKENKGTKEELAAELGVARMTLHRFEKTSGSNQKLAEYLYLRGMSPVIRLVARRNKWHIHIDVKRIVMHHIVYKTCYRNIRLSVRINCLKDKKLSGKQQAVNTAIKRFRQRRKNGRLRQAFCIFPFRHCLRTYLQTFCKLLPRISALPT